MSPVEWYYARDNKQMGPVSSVELKRLAAAGELEPEHLVWREGMAEWTLAGNVRGLFEEESRTAESVAAGVVQPGEKSFEADAPPSESMVSRPISAAGRPKKSFRHPFDQILDRLRSRFDERLIRATAKRSLACGSYGFLASIVLNLALAGIAVSRAAALSPVLWGLAVVFVLAAMQYVAVKACEGAGRIQRATDGRLSSTLVPDSFALLSKVAGVAFLLWSIDAAIETSRYEPLIVGAAVFLTAAYAAILAIQLAALHIAISPEVGAGEEALGVLAFVFKVLLHLAPVVFALGAVWGTLTLGYACYAGVVGGSGLLAMQIASAFGNAILVGAAAAPLAAYLAFLLFCLGRDLCCAVLGRSAGERGAESEETGGAHPAP